MRPAILFLMLILVSLLAIATLNWDALQAAFPLSLGFTVVDAPLGLVLLGLSILLTMYFLIVMSYAQFSVLLDSRRANKELIEARKRADTTEASALDALRAFINEELQRRGEADAASRDALLARFDKLETAMRTGMEELENSVAAHIGQVEDRIEPKNIEFLPESADRR